jgi:hypothetical protein
MPRPRARRVTTAVTICATGPDGDRYGPQGARILMRRQRLVPSITTATPIEITATPAMKRTIWGHPTLRCHRCTVLSSAARFLSSQTRRGIGGPPNDASLGPAPHATRTVPTYTRMKPRKVCITALSRRFPRHHVAARQRLSKPETEPSRRLISLHGMTSDPARTRRIPFWEQPTPSLAD